jgi:hypothetical protein
MTGGANNTSLGANSRANSGATGAGFLQNATAIGYNAFVDTSNTMVLGGLDNPTFSVYPSVIVPGSQSIGTTRVPSSTYALDVSGNINVSGLLQVQNNYINRASPNIIIGDISLNAPFYSYYSINNSALTIRIPTAAENYLGTTITFRRTIGAVNVVTISPSIYPLNSSTQTTSSLLLTNVFQTTICCMLQTSAPTYAWFAIN